VHDAPARVGCFAAEFEVAPGLQIELRTGGRQLTNTRRTLFDENLDGLGISEGCARCQRSFMD